MALNEWDTVTYNSKEAGKYEKSVEYRIKELKQKVVNWTITADEKEELSLLK